MFRFFVAFRRTLTTNPLYSALLPASYVSRSAAYLPTLAFVSDRTLRKFVLAVVEHAAVDVRAAARLVTVPAATRRLCVPPLPSGTMQPPVVAPVPGTKMAGFSG